MSQAKAAVMRPHRSSIVELPKNADIYAPLEESINVKNQITSLSGPRGEDIVLDKPTGRSRAKPTIAIPTQQPVQTVSPKRRSLLRTSSNTSNIRKKKRLFKKAIQKVYVTFDEFPEMRNVLRVHKFSCDDELPKEATANSGAFAGGITATSGIAGPEDDDMDFMFLSSIKKPKMIEEKEKLERVTLQKLVDEDRKEKIKQRKRQRKLENEALFRPGASMVKQKQDDLEIEGAVKIDSDEEAEDALLSEQVKQFEQSCEELELTNRNGSIYFKQEVSTYRYSYVDREKRSFKRSNSDTNLYAELFTSLASKHNVITDWEREEEEHNTNDLASLLIDPTLASTYQLSKLAEDKRLLDVQQTSRPRSHSQTADVHLINKMLIANENDEYNERLSKKLMDRANERERLAKEALEVKADDTVVAEPTSSRRNSVSPEKITGSPRRNSTSSPKSRQGSPRNAQKREGISTPRTFALPDPSTVEIDPSLSANITNILRLSNPAPKKADPGQDKEKSRKKNNKLAEGIVTSTHKIFASAPVLKREKVDFIARNIELLRKKKEAEKAALDTMDNAVENVATETPKLGVPIRIYAVNKLSIDLRPSVKERPDAPTPKSSYMGTPTTTSVYQFPAKPTSLNAKRFEAPVLLQQELAEEEQSTWVFAKPTIAPKKRPSTALANKRTETASAHWSSALKEIQPHEKPNNLLAKRPSSAMAGAKPVKKTSTMMGMTVSSVLIDTPLSQRPSSARMRISRLNDKIE
jgi:hypothetical protein